MSPTLTRRQVIQNLAIAATVIAVGPLLGCSAGNQSESDNNTDLDLSGYPDDLKYSVEMLPVQNVEETLPFVTFKLNMGGEDITFRSSYTEIAPEQVVLIRRVAEWYGQTYGAPRNKIINIMGSRGESAYSLVHTSNQTSMGSIFLMPLNEIPDPDTQEFTIADELSTALYADEGSMPSETSAPSAALFAEGISRSDAIIYFLETKNWAINEIIAKYQTPTGNIAFREICDYMNPYILFYDQNGNPITDQFLFPVLMSIHEGNAFSIIGLALSLENLELGEAFTSMEQELKANYIEEMYRNFVQSPNWSKRIIEKRPLINDYWKSEPSNRLPIKDFMKDHLGIDVNLLSKLYPRLFREGPAENLPYPMALAVTLPDYVGNDSFYSVRTILVDKNDHLVNVPMGEVTDSPETAAQEGQEVTRKIFRATCVTLEYIGSDNNIYSISTLGTGKSFAISFDRLNPKIFTGKISAIYTENVEIELKIKPGQQELSLIDIVDTLNNVPDQVTKIPDTRFDYKADRVI
ncbi:hypothetical protein JW887_02535 [Candidatus Dojkabacteria bacterium]|nr:hypothetical protein [Candidatus Dojkabacteria bacterium]